MSNKKLFEEAIVDAKAVREAALLNAKEALEEALTPSIQNMLVAKLNEMDTEEGEMEEGMYPSDTQDEIQDDYRETGAALEEEEFDLSAILAELEAEELNEAKDEEELEEAKKKEEEGEEEEGEEETEETEEEEMDVKDMSIEDLKDLIKDIVSQELETGETGAEAGEEEMSMNMGDEMGGEEMGASDEEEINLDELLAELESLDKNEELEEAKKKKDEKKDEKKEMKEAINVINTLRKELNEVNLLNAKLLYVNKIFKSKNLTESQKLNVIASFDKATTPKEAKMVYESLEATLNTAKKKSPIKESLGFASKAAGIAPKKQIVESNDVISRMQKLANIIK